MNWKDPLYLYGNNTKGEKICILGIQFTENRSKANKEVVLKKVTTKSGVDMALQ